MSQHELVDFLSGLPDIQFVEFVGHELSSTWGEDESKPLFEMIYGRYHRRRMAAWSYTSPQYWGFYLTLIRAFRPWIEGKSIIDIGSAYGNLWTYLCYPLKKLVLTDISEAALALAKLNLKDLPCDIEYRCQDLLTLSERELKHDVVMSVDTLRYIHPRSRLRFYRTMRRNLSGMIITGGKSSKHSDELVWPDKYINPWIHGKKYECIWQMCTPNPMTPLNEEEAYNFYVWSLTDD